MPSRNKVEIVITAQDDASSKIEGVFNALQKGAALAAAGVVAAVGAVQGFNAVMREMAKESASAQQVERAFMQIADASGESTDILLKNLKESSAGMVTQTDLMKSYNKAAQLVSVTFANQLPDAMTALRKVSAATGEDMDYMLNSLVTGIGRLSPMILDNLGIQVDLTKAYEDYAASIGKSVDELSKQEQQTALMNQVMEKLNANTANMPDVMGSAATKAAQLEVKISELKTALGRAYMPVYQRFLDGQLAFIDRIAPIAIQLMEKYAQIYIRVTDRINEITTSFVNWIKNLRSGNVQLGRFQDAADSVQQGIARLSRGLYNIRSAFRSFQNWVAIGRSPLEAFQITLHQLFPTWLANAINKNINNTVYTLSTLWNNRLKPLFTEIRDFVMSLFSGEAGQGAQQISQLVQTFWALLSPLGRIKLVLETMGVDFTPLIEGITRFFAALNEGGSVADAFTAAFGESQETAGLLSIFEDIKSFVLDSLLPALQNLGNWFTGSLLPLLADVVATIATTVLPALWGLLEWFIMNGLPFITSAITIAWETIIKPAFWFLRDVWEMIRPALEELGNWIWNEGIPALEDLADRVRVFVEENKPLVTAIVLATGLLFGMKVAATAATVAQTGLNTAVNLAGAFQIGIQNLGSLIIKLGAVTLAIWAVIEAWNKMQETVDIVKQGAEDVGNAFRTAVEQGRISVEDVSIGDWVAEFAAATSAQLGGGIMDQWAQGVANLVGGETVRSQLTSNANGGIYTSPGIGLIGEDLSGMSFEAVLNSDQIRELLAEARQGGSTTNNYFQGGPRNALEAQRYGNTIGTTLKAQGF